MSAAGCARYDYGYVMCRYACALVLVLLLALMPDAHADNSTFLRNSAKSFHVV